jgi:hypothetical protein
MHFEVISEHTENVLNLMMDKAIREDDPAYGHLADTWYTMAEGALSFGRSWQTVVLTHLQRIKEEWQRAFAILLT